MTDTTPQQEHVHTSEDPLCIESKLLALHTSTVCLARALVISGALDRRIFHAELMQARAWLGQFDTCGHNQKAFDDLLEMLGGI